MRGKGGQGDRFTLRGSLLGDSAAVRVARGKEGDELADEQATDESTEGRGPIQECGKKTKGGPESSNAYTVGEW